MKASLDYYSSSLTSSLCHQHITSPFLFLSFLAVETGSVCLAVLALTSNPNPYPNPKGLRTLHDYSGHTTLRLTSSRASRHRTIHEQITEPCDWRMHTLLSGIANAPSRSMTSHENLTCEILTTWPTSHATGKLTCMLMSHMRHNRPYAYDVIISLRHHLGDIHVGLRVNAVVRDLPAADHKRVQGNGFCPQHGGAMTSVHKVYTGHGVVRPWVVKCLETLTLTLTVTLTQTHLSEVLWWC